MKPKDIAGLIHHIQTDFFFCTVCSVCGFLIVSEPQQPSPIKAPFLPSFLAENLLRPVCIPSASVSAAAYVYVSPQLYCYVSV
jgi:hypothetical protein